MRAVSSVRAVASQRAFGLNAIVVIAFAVRTVRDRQIETPVSEPRSGEGIRSADGTKRDR
jgi:hypothetical protein